MKNTFETKVSKKNVINLQPVQIDIQMTQKLIPSYKKNPLYQTHLKTAHDHKIILSYNNIVNQIIEDMLISLSDNINYDFLRVQEILKINKQRIDYISIINLEIIQKLSYLLEKCQTLQYSNYQICAKVLREEIKYWKQFLLFALNDHTEEIQKYGEVCKNTVKFQINKMEQEVMQPKQNPLAVNYLKKEQFNKQINKKIKFQQVPIEPGKIPKAPRRNGRNRNGNGNAGNQISDNIDN